MSTSVTPCFLSLSTRRLRRTALPGIRYCQAHSTAFSPRRRIQPRVERRQSCKAVASQQQSHEKLPYGILPLEAEVKGKYAATDRWAAVNGLVALGLWVYRGKPQLTPWVMQNMHLLKILGCLAIIASLATAFVHRKNRAVDFWCKQQRRSSYIDIIPALASDVATIKQDVAQIKNDVEDIKQMLSRPWYKLL